jgi:hypothetical protein
VFPVSRDTDVTSPHSMSTQAKFPLGHEPLPHRLNIRKELRHLRADPMAPLISELGGDRRFARVFQDTISRYEETYELYYLSLKRFLPEQSLAGRWQRGPYYKLKYGGKYTEPERRLAHRFNAIAEYLYLDFYNCLLWARMLLDRIASLSKYFLTGKALPSFHSFGDHKKFFVRLTRPFGEHEAYASYIRSNTDWFEIPLKHVRDTYVVHSSPPHIRTFGHPTPGDELNLILHRTPVTPSEPPIVISVARVSRELNEFQRWFAEYGLQAIKRRRVEGITGD